MKDSEIKMLATVHFGKLCITAQPRAVLQVTLQNALDYARSSLQRTQKCNKQDFHGNLREGGERIRI